VLANEDQKTGNQIVVAVFRSLDGEELVDYSNRLFKTWNPGKKGHDNGVLLAAYLKEHKLRIEVGYGLEPILTDAKTRLILENAVTPSFKNQDYGQGLLNGVQAMLAVIHPEQASGLPTPVETVPDSSQSRAGFPPIVIIFLIIFLIRIFSFRRRGFLGGIFLGGGGGGWSSGGGGGFGGFSGGGGSSGGGGASGGW